MWRLTLFVLGAAITLVLCNDDEIICEGEWSVNAAFPCPNPDQYPCKLTAIKHMLNRHTDCYDVSIDLPEEINERSHGVYLELCKKVDGGCKLQYAENKASLCQFLEQIASDNFHAVLDNMGLENPKCPIPKGAFNLLSFPFNYKELPNVSITGDFIGTGYIMKGAQKQACIKMDFSFKKTQDD